MQLVMPGSYVEMREDEMMYLDGGISTKDKAAIIAIAIAGGVALTVAIAYGQIALGARIMGWTMKQFVRKLGAAGVATVVAGSLGVSYTATLAVVKFLV
ncbi:hypothetical protein [Neobacillus niacini]|uniref:hypothetical protein n=1 Tax=Neobacillus niacini TaxID=86668 RepID=UPI0039839798